MGHVFKPLAYINSYTCSTGLDFLLSMVLSFFTGEETFKAQLILVRKKEPGTRPKPYVGLFWTNHRQFEGFACEASWGRLPFHTRVMHRWCMAVSEGVTDLAPPPGWAMLICISTFLNQVLFSEVSLLEALTKIQYFSTTILFPSLFPWLLGQ